MLQSVDELPMFQLMNNTSKKCSIKGYLDEHLRVDNNQLPTSETLDHSYLFHRLDFPYTQRHYHNVLRRFHMVPFHCSILSSPVQFLLCMELFLRNNEIPIIIYMILCLQKVVVQKDSNLSGGLNNLCYLSPNFTAIVAFVGATIPPPAIKSFLAVSIVPTPTLFPFARLC